MRKYMVWSFSERGFCRKGYFWLSFLLVEAVKFSFLKFLCRKVWQMAILYFVKKAEVGEEQVPTGSVCAGWFKFKGDVSELLYKLRQQTIYCLETLSVVWRKYFDLSKVINLSHFDFSLVVWCEWCAKTI